jgi:hypothetical protein
MKTNVDKLKASIAKTQQEFTGRGGILAQHIEQTDKNYQTAMRKAEEISNNCIAKHDDFIRQSEAQRAQQMAEQQKRMNEMGEKREDFCSRFGMLDTNPNAACDGNLRETVSGARAVGSSEADRLNRICSRVQQETNSTSAAVSVQTICTDPVNLPGQGETITPNRMANDLKTLCYTLGQVYESGSTVCPVNGNINNGNGNGNGNGTATGNNNGNNNNAVGIDAGCISRIEGRITAIHNRQNPVGGGSNVADNSGDTVGSPSICTANGDRNDGSLMGGGNRLQLFANELTGGQVNLNP